MPIAAVRAVPPTVSATTATAEQASQRRFRRVVAAGPRCPDCGGPVVFGEGCRLCPICGWSACA